MAAGIDLNPVTNVAKSAAETQSFERLNVEFLTTKTQSHQGFELHGFSLCLGALVVVPPPLHLRASVANFLNNVVLLPQRRRNTNQFTILDLRLTIPPQIHATRVNRIS